MKLDYCIRELEANATTIAAFVSKIDDAQASWKPSEDEWSILEVINHLLDEEREDFPFRLRHILSANTEPWPGIRPGEWAQERNYNERDPDESLADFLLERDKNLKWLRSLSNPTWETKYHHEPLKGISAGDFLAAWTVHDLLHIRQLNELKYRYGEQQLEGYALMYAGDW